MKIQSGKISRRFFITTVTAGSLSSSGLAQTTAEAGVANSRPGRSKEHIETEIVIIGRGGVSPSQITRPSDKFFLEVLNQMPGQPWDLTIVRVSSEADGRGSAIDSRLTQKRYQSIGLLDLPAGEYRLQTTSGDRILCQITLR